MTTPLERAAMFAGVPVEVEVELDRQSMTVRELLALEEGTLIRTRRPAGDNIDIHVGGALVAFGEIVEVDSVIGVRVTDFHGPAAAVPVTAEPAVNTEDGD